MLWHGSALRLWLNIVPLYGHSKPHLSIHQVAIEAVSTLWIMQIVLL